jgi:hypothetical protein
MAPHGATKTSPYELVYGHHAVLPWEIQLDSRRVVLQRFKFQRLQWLNDGRVRGFAYDSS